MANPAGPGRGSQLDLRLVTYFVAVAEHLSFGRAAQELRIAQPSLSRQIRRLEQIVGTRLLERHAQGSRLTLAGEVFLPRAIGLLRQADLAVQAAHHVLPGRALTIGYVEDLVVTPAVRDLRRLHPDAYVRTRHLHWDELRALDEGIVDAVLVRTPVPVPDADLDLFTVLDDEPQVLVLPLSHPLAGYDRLSPEDLADDSWVACTRTAPTWSGFWVLEPSPVNDSQPLAPLSAGRIEDKLEMIANGQALAVLPATDRRLSGRKDLAVVEATGFSPAGIAVATRPGETNSLVKDFQRLAKARVGFYRNTSELSSEEP
ncbi:LysR family transcriptional regulator [Kineosporia sp. J2-2]|uniref:LysR family transcriptional regulator n=1 Tax=Kineosporia corallincola TaxID=2835133 RepID=A0ABS5TAZ1_9ACTN|nr:LysR family transcriptional regulator [Kineosporia corallincola]MBT0768237.1 LysR family transcriptional regulator [Kineosporia corallincola]